MTRPPRPKPIDESQIPQMTRGELHDLLMPAIEHYQQSPRWPNLTPKQTAEYDTFMRIFQAYFPPGAGLAAARDYVQTGDDGYWGSPAVPAQRDT